MEKINRRDFLKTLGLATATVAGASALASCKSGSSSTDTTNTQAWTDDDLPTDQMTYRTNPNTGDHVSLLGYGCMRWPIVAKASGREDADNAIDQEQVNRLVDYAMAHGVNYYDTSPAYCQGRSEHATGIALARHDRKKYYIATKLSNFAPQTWSHQAGVEMFENSLRELQTDYIDYYLLHCIGQRNRDLEGNELDGMQALHARFLDNGMLDWCVEQKKKGRIRNLGWSYHGDIEVVDYLLQLHDEGKYHWDFVQIQHNYVDWQHAKEINPSNTNGEYLYGELAKRGIPAIIMEPLLGGRLARVPAHEAARLKALRPDDSVAAWAFRYAGSMPDVLTVLSGMTYMENLQDNLHTYCPLQPCTEEEYKLLYDVAQVFVDNPFIPCTDCKYCMPCPYGIDIPSIFRHYNRCINEDHYNKHIGDPKYKEARRAFLVGLDRSVPRLRQAAHCIGCGECKSHCPQRIDIPAQLRRIDEYVEVLKMTPDV